MTTTFFRFKKSIKRIIKGLLPEYVYAFIIAWYRLFFSKLPLKIEHLKRRLLFTKRQSVRIKNSHISIIVDPKNGATDAGLYFHKERDVDVINVMKNTLFPGSIFVDIGANIGYETLWGAFLVGAQGKVYAFEPIAHLAEQIKESIHLNEYSNITLLQKAAGEKDGKERIYFHKEDAGLTSIENRENATNSMEIEITTLDKELVHIASLALIKLDVEGYEYEALKGAEKMLQKFHPVIVFEFSPHLYEKSHPGKSLEILTFLDNLGYSIYPIDQQDNIITPDQFEALIQKILDDETIPNFIAR
jgi:FkbM family methyltransferase